VDVSSAYAALLMDLTPQEARREAAELVASLAAVLDASETDAELRIHLDGPFARQFKTDQPAGTAVGDEALVHFTASLLETIGQRRLRLSAVLAVADGDLCGGGWLLEASALGAARRRMADALWNAALRCGGALVRFVRQHSGEDPGGVIVPDPPGESSGVVAASVVINLAQCAYRAGTSGMAGLRDELSDVAELATRALVERRSLLGRLASRSGRPLNPAASSGLIDLPRARYTVAVCGLDEALRFLGAGREELTREAVRLLSHLHFTLRDMGREHGIPLALNGRGPSADMALRLARIDLDQHPESRLVLTNDPALGTPAAACYSVGAHLPSTEPRRRRIEEQIQRLCAEGRLHSLAEASESTAFVEGDGLAGDTLTALAETVLKASHCNTLQILTDFVTCSQCRWRFPGRPQQCPRCGSEQLIPSLPPEPEQAVNRGHEK
jgi:hypothetical protein